MKIIFRVDASRRIGTGHIIRCLTLARVLQNRGGQCGMLQRRHEGNLIELVSKSGLDSYELAAPPPANQPIADEDYAAWLGVTTSADARESKEVLGHDACDWLVIDHYSLDESWEQSMRSHAGRILVIDDLANRFHDCDTLVDQNYYRAGRGRYQDLLPESARILTGPRYALLGERYRKHRPKRPAADHAIRRVLIYYGGVDPTNETSRALRVLSLPEFADLDVDVVIGINNPHHKEAEQLIEQRPRTYLHDQQNDLVDLMLSADLTLGAGGTTTWERCCLGLPSVVTTVAANQVLYNRELARDGLIAYAGDSSQLTDDRLAAILGPLVKHPHTAADLARNSWRLVDGWGAVRVAELMLPTPPEQLTLRDAEAGDISLFFEWANEIENRRHSFDPKPVSWKTHVEWFDQRLASDHAWLWVLCADDGLPVGEAHIEKKSHQAVLSFSLDADYRGRGWGGHFLQKIAERWQIEQNTLPLIGEVLKTNPASMRCFEATGCFRSISDNDTHQTYQLEKTQ